MRARAGVEQAIARGLAYAPYADVIWCETAEPNVEEARRFAEGIHARFPGKLLAYNCSPSFNWKKKLDNDTIARFQRELGAMGYKFQFVTLAGFHALNFSMYELALDYKGAVWQPTPISRPKSSRPKSTAIPPPSTSARSAPATSMRSR